VATRDLTAAVAAEVVKGAIRPALLYEGVFNESTLNFWTGSGTLSWDSKTWQGNGLLQGFSDVVDGVDSVGGGRVAVVFSGLDASLLSAVLNNARQGDLGRVWLALLVDKNLENLLPNSEEFNTTVTSGSDTSWTKSYLTVTEDHIANPIDRQANGCKLQESVDTGNHWVYAEITPLANGVRHQVSVYAKALSRSKLALQSSGGGWPTATVYFNLATGAVQSESGAVAASAIRPAGAGWYLCSMDITTTGTTQGELRVAMCSSSWDVSYAGEGKTCYVYGAQLRRVSSSGIYARTTTAPITSEGRGDKVIADPYLLFEGKLDTPELQRAPEGVSLSISYQANIAALSSGSNHRYTHEGQRAFYSSDEGFAYVSSAKTWAGSWGVRA
jgi:hypothetical protein